MRFYARGSAENALSVAPIAAQECRGEEGGVIPHLAVRQAFVVLRDERGCRLDYTCADLAAGCRLTGCVQKVRCDAQLQQPDGLEIRAEENPRRPEHVVAVRIVRVALGIAMRDVACEPGVRRVPSEEVQQRGMHRAFGQPELIRVDPPAVMQIAAKDAVARRATVVVRRVRIEHELNAVVLAPSAGSRKQRLGGRYVQVALEERSKIQAEGVGERRERSRRRGSPFVDPFRREQKHFSVIPVRWTIG